MLITKERLWGEAKLEKATLNGKTEGVMTFVPLAQVTVVESAVIFPLAGIEGLTEQLANASLVANIRMPADVSDKATIWLRM